MNKALLVLLCIGVAASLRMSHLDTTADTTNGPADPFAGMAPEQAEAYERLLGFAMSDNSLRRSLMAKKDLTSVQLKKLIGFMRNDPFFQNQLLDGIIATPGNEWVSSVSKEAQIRYLKIITDYTPEQYEKQSILRAVVNRLKADRELGPALKAKFGDNFDTESFKQIANQVQSSASLSHRLAYSR